VANVRNLGTGVREFAETTQHLLNKTICDHALVSGVVDRDGTRAFVGTHIDRFSFQSSPARLRSKAKTPLWLDFSCHLMIDEGEGLFLAVQSSFFGVSVGRQDDRRPILHYDFERGKDRYTEAHLQVHGRHKELEEYALDIGAKDRLAKYHLPVGGRRFRPCIEDVIEFLVAERLVDPKSGWDDVLECERKTYRMKQIAAVVRKNPGTAINELERLGYRMAPPTDPTLIEKIKYLARPTPKARKDEDVAKTGTRTKRR